MIIELKKFGRILTSRESGREARAAFLPTLQALDDKATIKVDFQGVSVLSTSWAAEFLTPLLNDYRDRLSFVNDDNPSVRVALELVNPNLDFSKVTVFADNLVFDEKVDYAKISQSDKARWIPTFPYSDEDALQKLIDNGVKEILVEEVDKLDKNRLNKVIAMLKKAGIKPSGAATRN